MPTYESRIHTGVIVTQWIEPLTTEELDVCFRHLKAMLDTTSSPTHILFDLQEAGSVPHQAPLLAIRSKFLTSNQLDKVAVVSTDIITQILSKTASRVTKHEILFFPTYEAATDFLKAHSAVTAGQQ